MGKKTDVELIKLVGEKNTPACAGKTLHVTLYTLPRP